VLAIAFWFALARSGVFGPTLLADPLEVLAVLGREFQPDVPASSRLLLHLGATLGRALVGWAWAMVLGVSAGWLLGRARTVRRLSSGVLELVRAIPPILVFPLFLVHFDYTRSAYQATIAFGAAPIVALSVASAMRRSGGVRHELLQVFGASAAARHLARVMDLLPSLVLSARIALSLSLVIAVVTEMVFAPRSGFALGAYAKDAEMTFDTPAVYASMLLVGAIGLVLNALLALLGRRRGGALGA